MADRTVHYEAAFEAFLRSRGIPYVAVDETRRSLAGDKSLKSLDFIVSPPEVPGSLLIDVKGRQRRDHSSRRSFESWTPERDVTDLLQWEQVFGEGFRAVLAFIYWIETPLTPEPGMFEHRDRWYLLMGIDLAEYRNSMRRRSAKWETVCLPAEEFRNLARPLESWL